MRELLSGNEALARGAYEYGVTVACGYPGTPSTEILEAAVKFKDVLYCEWSPNEKVAFEVAAGAALTGARCLVTMKHVGLNVAADPLLTLAYTGVVGGFVAVVADDPGMHSSQNEQDTRHYAVFAKVPMLEPSDSQEAKDFVGLGLELSEQFGTPVILRSCTRVSHSRGLVELGKRKAAPKPIGFNRDPRQFVMVPAHARQRRNLLEEKLAKMQAAAEASAVNRIEWRERKLGIITSSVSYQYVREIMPEASVLKLGWSFPYPDKLIKEFAAGLSGTLLVVEELDDLLEQHIRALGIACEGRRYISGIGELLPARLQEVRARLEGKAFQPIVPVAQAADLPARPPVLCPGCPHRGIFAALNKFDVIVAGDIGCYSLGVLPPLARLDTILCMGGGVSMAHGMQKGGEPKKVVGIVGDSTFFHSGITGLLDIGYNRGAATIIVVDNRTTGMTGHQDNPGSGRTLMGEATCAASVEDFGRVCGIKRIRTVNPYDLNNTIDVLEEELEAPEASLIVSRAECPLQARRPVGPKRAIAPELCRKCGACLKLGCPAIQGGQEKPEINPQLCGGCGLCEVVCRFAAVTAGEKE